MKNFTKKYLSLSFLTVLVGAACSSHLWCSEKHLEIDEKKKTSEPPTTPFTMERFFGANEQKLSSSLNDFSFATGYNAATDCFDTIDICLKGWPEEKLAFLVFENSPMERHLNALIEAADANRTIYYQYDNWFLNLCFPTNAQMHRRFFERLEALITRLDDVIKLRTEKLLEEKREIVLEFEKKLIEKLKTVRAAYMPLWRDASALFFLRNPCSTIVVLLVVGYLFDRHFMGRVSLFERKPMAVNGVITPKLNAPRAGLGVSLPKNIT